MLTCEDFEGLSFHPYHDVVALAPFLDGRLRAVTRQGEVLHTGRLPPDGPWVRQGHAWVLPDALTHGHDAAGFHYPGQPQGSAGLPPDPLYLPELALQAHQVQGWRAGTWLTDEGERPGPPPHLHPDLVKVKKNLFVNRRRLRKLTPQAALLDTGQLFAPLTPYLATQLAGRLGASLQPALPAVREFKLRDWPCELFETEAEQLREWFDDPNILIANVILQTLLYRLAGIDVEYGKDHRGFWYRPVSSVLQRAGFITDRQLRWSESKKAASARYHRVLMRLVNDFRLCTLQQLGFKDPANRRIGDRRPQTVLLLEKSSLEPHLDELHHQFGATTLVSGGSTKLVDAEFLAAELLALGIDRIEVLALVDYDPAGWDLAEAFLPQLARYGITADLRMVVTAACFTPREIRLHAYPCPAHTPALATQTRRWLEKSGGIQGRPLGIGADHFRPVERIVARLREMLC